MRVLSGGEEAAVNWIIALFTERSACAYCGADFGWRWRWSDTWHHPANFTYNCCQPRAVFSEIKARREKSNPPATEGDS